MSISADFTSDSNSDNVDYVPDSFDSGSDSDFSVNCDMLSEVCTWQQGTKILFVVLFSVCRLC